VQGKRPIHGNSWAPCCSAATVRFEPLRMGTLGPSGRTIS